MLEGHTILVFADDWAIHPSSAQHLLAQFLPRNRVIWFNTTGTRLPRWSATDLKKIARKLPGWLTGPPAPPKARSRGTPLEPHVVELLLLPPTLGHWARRRNASVLHAALEQSIRSAPSPSILLSTLPLTADIVGQVPGILAVYYLVDDYASWPGRGGEIVRHMDLQQLRAADLIVAASRDFASAQQHHTTRPIHHLPHGVDIEHFSAARRARQQHRAPDLAEIVFFGALDERIDQTLLEAVARARPQRRFLIVGPQDRVAPGLRTLANVRLQPPVPYRELPTLLARCRIAFLPYVLTSLGRNLSPLKVREALAAGLPVVATNVPDLRSFERGVHCADRAVDIACLLDSLVDREPDVPALADLAADSWQVRAEHLSTLISRMKCA